MNFQHSLHFLLKQYQDSPDNSHLTFQLAILFDDSGQKQKAYEFYLETIRLEPQHQEAIFNAGVLKAQQRKWNEAAEHFKQYCLNNSFDSGALNYLIRVLIMGKRISEIQKWLSLFLNSNVSPGQIYDLAIICHENECFEEAILLYQTVFEENVENLPLLSNLAMAYYAIADTTQARSYLKKAWLLNSYPETRLKLALAQPIIRQSQYEVEKCRLEFEEIIQELIHKKVSIEHPLHKVDMTNFYMSYQGYDDKDNQVLLATFYQQASSELCYQAPFIQNYQREKTKKVKIGFISQYFYNHSISKVFMGIMLNLSREHFELTVLATSQPFDESGYLLQSSADHFEVLSPHLQDAQKQVASLQLDIVFYWELGLSPFTYFLAFSRLAPIQCMSWGHGVTSGISTIDYIFLSQYLTTKKVQEYFSESVILTQKLLSYYYQPQPCPSLKKRIDFGCLENENLYYCPQSLFKLHPDYDEVLLSILKADPQGKLILIKGKIPQWTEQLTIRLKRSLGRYMNQIVWSPRLEKEDFRQLALLSDVILDPFYTGGGTTTLDLINMGTPIITFPTDFCRGRVTLACYQQMGVMDCVVDSREAYIQLALKLGKDRDFNRQVRAKIKANVFKIYQQDSVVREFEELLLALRY